MKEKKSFVRNTNHNKDKNKPFAAPNTTECSKSEHLQA
jgi:hypothetical protein